MRRSPALAAAFVALATLAACTPGTPDAASARATLEAGRVLVVVNDESDDSRLLGAYYAQRRGIPFANMVHVRVPVADEISATAFYDELVRPVRAAIHASPTRIDFIVLIKGIPLRIDTRRGYSVDGQLVLVDSIDGPPLEEPTMITALPHRNPYYARREPFDSRRFGMYLVTRLDCYELAQCRALVDRASAALPEPGLFFFNPSLNHEGAYGALQAALLEAHLVLRELGFTSRIAQPGVFEAPAEALAGYASWGSNDPAFDRDSYLRLRFKPGALAETFVSTSARTFSRTMSGQSLIADLIEGGVTGVKGYVSEPYAASLARPQILFERYVSGYSLAESMYMASPFIRWKDLVIGDPICRPYAPTGTTPPPGDTAPPR